ncbi:MAG: hypothetical protein EXR76_08820 [Myxococcales bacterium]|nr:hypothetical protein [Myxococcales bacterium]
MTRLQRVFGVAFALSLGGCLGPANDDGADDASLSGDRGAQAGGDPTGGVAGTGGAPETGTDLRPLGDATAPTDADPLGPDGPVVVSRDQGPVSDRPMLDGPRLEDSPTLSDRPRPPLDGPSPEPDFGAESACTGAADRAALLVHADEAQMVVGNCALGCFAQPSSCAPACVQGSLGISAGCAACFGDLVACAVANCFQVCGVPGSAACTACRAMFCDEALELCAGFPQP